MNAKLPEDVNKQASFDKTPRRGRGIALIAFALIMIAMVGYLVLARREGGGFCISGCG